MCTYVCRTACIDRHLDQHLCNHNYKVLPGLRHKRLEILFLSAWIPRRRAMRSRRGYRGGQWKPPYKYISSHVLVKAICQVIKKLTKKLKRTLNDWLTDCELKGSWRFMYWGHMKSKVLEYNGAAKLKKRLWYTHQMATWRTASICRSMELLDRVRLIRSSAE